MDMKNKTSMEVVPMPILPYHYHQPITNAALLQSYAAQSISAGR